MIQSNETLSSFDSIHRNHGASNTSRTVYFMITVVWFHHHRHSMTSGTKNKNKHIYRGVAELRNQILIDEASPEK